MSKQSQANALFAQGTNMNKSRSEIIAEIQRVIGVKPAYASTLYSTAKKKSTPKVKTPYEVAADQPEVTSHSKPTSKIESFDRTNLRMLRVEIDGAIADVLAKHGLKVNVGNISYSGQEFTTKVTVNVPGAVSRKDQQAESAFKMYASMEGLKAEDFGKQFTTHSGETFEITGYSTRAKKYPIKAKRVKDGHPFKFPVSQVKLALSRS